MSKRRPPPEKTFTVPRIAGAAAVLAVLIAAIGTAAGFFRVPGLGWLDGLFGEIPYPELTLEGPQPTGAVLQFSLEWDIYDEAELGSALNMREALQQRLPELLFNLTPLESEGVMTYALHVGPAIDAVDAHNLKAPLAEVFTEVEDPESWRIQATPRAFYLGEREALTEAQELLASAEAAGIFGYILHVTYPDGSGAFQVLSGAFESVSDARGWQMILRETRFRDAPLIQRRGRPPE